MSQNKHQNQKNKTIWFGTIANTHGIKGELKILTNSDNPGKRLKVGKMIFIEMASELQEYEITSSRKNKNNYLIRIDNLQDINQVEHFKTKKIFVERIEDSNTFYLSDLIGYKVFNQTNELGTIISFFDQKAYYSYELKMPNGKITNIPIIDEIDWKIDNQNKIVTTNFKGE